MNRRSTFRPGLGVYACRICPRQTRDDEGSVRLCAECYEVTR